MRFSRDIAGNLTTTTSDERFPSGRRGTIGPGSSDDRHNLVRILGYERCNADVRKRALGVGRENRARTSGAPTILTTCVYPMKTAGRTSENW